MICEKRFKALTASVGGSIQKSERESKVAIQMAANIDTQAEKKHWEHVNSGVQVCLQTAIMRVSKARMPGTPICSSWDHI